jgi:IclR family pca regulon transcriptional regulator
MTKSAERPVHHVQSLERGLAVIAAFDADHPELTLTDVAERTDLSRSAVRRFLLTLTDLGYARRSDRIFSLTPKVLDLGYAYLSSQRLPEIVQPHLESLVADVNESSSVSVMDGDDILYVARVATPRRIMTVRISVGTRFPAAFTSMGRAMLAYVADDELEGFLDRADFTAVTSNTVTDRDDLKSKLSEIRKLGYAIVDQELEEGLRAIAAPIHDHEGRVIAAVNISTHANRTPLDYVRGTLAPRLLTAAADIDRDLSLTARKSSTVSGR